MNTVNNLTRIWLKRSDCENDILTLFVKNELFSKHADHSLSWPCFKTYERSKRSRDRFADTAATQTSIVSKDIMGCLIWLCLPGYPIIAIWNNKNQNGHRICKTVYGHINYWKWLLTRREMDPCATKIPKIGKESSFRLEFAFWIGAEKDIWRDPKPTCTIWIFKEYAPKVIITMVLQKKKQNDKSNQRDRYAVTLALS